MMIFPALTGDELGAVIGLRVAQAHDWWFGPEARAGEGDAEGSFQRLNSILADPWKISHGEPLDSAIPKLNLLRDPDAWKSTLLAGRVGIATGALAPATGRVWQDRAGTVPMTAPGQPVGQIDLLAGSAVARFRAPTDNARPTSARRPASGARNRANGSADVAATTFWPAAAGPTNGITATKVGSGTTSGGLPYVDYQISGTASADSFVELASALQARAAAEIGQVWTSSASLQLIAGTPPANALDGLRVQVVEENLSGAFIAATPSAPYKSGDAAVISSTRTLTEGAIATTRCGFNVRTSNGATVDYTIRIAGAQFELGSTRSAYQINMSAFDITEVPFADVWGVIGDGVDDCLISDGDVAWATDRVTLLAAVDKRSDAARGTIIELTNAGNGRFSLEAPGVLPSELITFRSGGSVPAQANTTNAAYAAPLSAILEGRGDISGDAASLRINGVEVATSAADQGAGTFSTAPLYLLARGGSSLFSTAFVSEIFAVNAFLPAAHLTALRRAFANRFGVTLP